MTDVTAEAAARHRAEMQALQAAHRDKMAEKSDAERGLVLVYTGNGKGKSSAAFGLIVRALGWDHRVGVVQFVKGKWVTGERRFFEQLGDERVTWKVMGEGFTWDVQDLARGREAACAALEAGTAMLCSGSYDLVILDEINIALRSAYLTAAEVLAAIAPRHLRTSVVLTGRNAPPELLEIADLVTEMTEVRHPFQAGIKARRGVDF